MHDIANRKMNQLAPPHIIFEALAPPSLDPRLVIAGTKRPDAVIRLAAAGWAGHATSRKWTLEVDEPIRDEALIGHVRKRLNALINAS